ncbi:hypothetical protein A4G20_07390 [Pasteurellaceae bacterium RH1A]|nr:hypothetical protein A4G20_07390 [Pasteurellaceae bacterium RH1A]
MAQQDLYPLLFKHLGTSTDSPSFKSLLRDSLGSQDFPSFEPEDEDDNPDVYAWVLVADKGLELGFTDKAYFDGKPDCAWFSDGAILSQLYFYCHFDDIEAYEGALPYDITWQDDRAAVLKKMQAATGQLRQSEHSDVWEFDGYLITVNYNQASQLAERVVIHLLPPPLKQTLPSWEVLAQYLDKPIKSDFMALWQGHFTQEMLEEAIEYDYNQIDLLKTYGVTLAVMSLDDELFLQGVTLYANREMDSIGWQGALPLGLDFNDSPRVLEEKIAQEPRIFDSEVNDGYAVWDFEDFSLRVLFSNFTNKLLRVSLEVFEEEDDNLDFSEDD